MQKEQVRRWFAGCACLLFAACGPKSAHAHADGRQHLVVITVEGLRSDVIGAYRAWFGALLESDAQVPALARTPYLDALADGSVLYSYALAPSAWCPPSLAGLWASDYPSRLDFTDLSEPLAPETMCLAEIFARNGWKTQALVEHPFLGVGTNLDQGFASYEHVVGASANERGEETLRKAKAQIRSMGSTSTLLWVQLGGLGPPFETTSAGEALSRSDWMRYRDDWTDEDLAALHAMYLAEVERLDGEIGQILQELRDQGLDKKTVVVVVGTNGCELLEHGLIGDAASLRAELIRVPLIIHIPGQLAGVIEEPVSLIDVAPSLLRLVGLSAPSRWAGISVLPGEPIPTRDLYSELHRGSKQRVAIRGDWKVLWDESTDGSQLFDIYADPWEARDLSRQKGAIHMDILGDLQTFAGEGQSDGAPN